MALTSRCGKEENLVEMAIRRILASLALFAGIICNQALAQQSGLTRRPDTMQQPVQKRAPQSRQALQQWRQLPPAQPWQASIRLQQPGQVRMVGYQSPAAPLEQQPIEQQQGLVQSEPQALDPQPGSPIAVQPGNQDLAQTMVEEDSVYQPFEQAVSACCDKCGGGAYCPPDWYVDQGVRIWHRSRAHRDLLISQFTSSYFVSEISGQNQWRVTPFTPTKKLMTTKSFGFDVATGYNITLGHYLGRDTQNRDHFVEAGYFGMNEWEVSRNHTGQTLPIYAGEIWTQAEYDEYIAGTRTPIVSQFVGSLLSSFPLVTFDGANFVFPDGGIATLDDIRISQAFNQVQEYAVTYNSRIDSFELNGRIRDRGRTDRLVLHPNGKWQRECQKGWFMSYLFGMRVITIDEGFGMRSRGTHYSVVDDQKLGAPLFTTAGSLNILTHNRLVGLQIGGDLIYRKCLWEWGFKYKIGPMMNFSDQTTRLVASQIDAGGTTTTTVNRRAVKDGAAGFADVGVVGSYKILPNMTFNCSWDWMWIAGLALAPEQTSYQRDSKARVNDNGMVFFQGLTLNLDVNW